ncbi:16S rRNA (cytidine(1402)-2'-O)-methyltransferase [Rhodobacteraceae bacterium 63075]|nr:16S rRNA (cytidine(1402)-2'-O)-methyltransferase [Rhodobacteraceae bacterium 63075]
MNHKEVELAAGLYLVATPIGTARDITLRALDVLASADVLAAEDTRSLRKLMEIHGVPLGGRRIVAYHDHSGKGARARLLAALGDGQSVAYASEAGTPMIADPGYHLVREAQQAGYLVTSAPGPSAVITALTLGGLPTDRFTFAGFLPNAGGARKKALEALRGAAGTLVFYESPKRVGAMLSDAAEILGEGRAARVCRELTKRFEEVRCGTLAELAAQMKDEAVKGEIVVLIEEGRAAEMSDEALRLRLAQMLETMSLRDAADTLAAETGAKRRRIYQMGLEIGGR